MKVVKTIFLLVLCVGFSFVMNAQMETVSIANGIVKGEITGELAIFKGIPFAAPPVGNLRWKEPQPVANWKGTLLCTKFSASPIQPTPAPFLCWSEEFIAPPEPLSEDCLYLNVWTAAKNKKEKRPVFVWIYGGGFSSGSAACAIYDGAEMAKRGIVFVSINYRVGPFGFMAHPDLSKEQNDASGNYGILDQIAALKWVRKNIAAFGGDPAQVTIAGQSAGSMSVYSLLASPLAKGLFHKAIAESGGISSDLLLSKLPDAEKTGTAIQLAAGANSLSDLRKKSAAEVLQASQGKGINQLGLVLDGYVLPKDLQQKFSTGQFNQVPLLLGWVSGDGSLFVNPDLTADQFRKQAAEKYGSRAAEFLEVFKADNDKAAQFSQTRLTLLSFAGFPAHKLASVNKPASFIYEVAHVPTNKPGFPNYGAFHTSEVPYALHTLHTWKRPWQQHDKDVEALMSTYWIQFIKTGNPNGNSLPEWKAYKTVDGSILEIDAITVLKPGLFKKEFDLLDKLETGK